MSDYPPDNYGLYGAATPVWNTDCELDTTTFLSSNASIHMLGTSAKAMQWTKDLVPCAAGDVFLVDAVMRQDDITAGNTHQVYISWWHSDKSFHDWTTIFDDELPAVDTWYTISGSATAPATACYACATYVRSANGFDAWLDTLGIKKMPKCFLAHLSAGATLSAGTTTHIQLNSEQYDYGSIYDNAVNYQFTAPSSGLYSIYGQIYINDLADGKAARASLGNSSGTALVLGPIFRNNTGGDASNILAVNAQAILLSAGDTIRLRGWTDDAGDITVTGAATWTTFLSGVQIA